MFSELGFTVKRNPVKYDLDIFREIHPENIHSFESD